MQRTLDAPLRIGEGLEVEIGDCVSQTTREAERFELKERKHLALVSVNGQFEAEWYEG